MKDLGTKILNNSVTDKMYFKSFSDLFSNVRIGEQGSIARGMRPLNLLISFQLSNLLDMILHQFY